MRTSLIAAVLSLLLVLPAAAAITGTVMTSDGKAVAGAKIELFSLEGASAMRARILSANSERTPLATAVSDAKGKFTIESPKDPVVTLTVTASGFAPEIDRIERDEDLGAIALTAAETKTGRIAANGKPVAGAKVVFDNGEWVATTDAQGRYAVPDPSKWASTIAVAHSDYAIDEPAGQRGGIGRFMPSRPPELDQTLASGAPVSGTVAGEDGKTPVAGATILLGRWPLAMSAQDGTFSIAHAPARWDTIVAKSGDLVGVRSQSALPVTIKLAKGASVAGSIRDGKTRAPIAGAEVMLVEPGTVSGSVSAVTDAKGSFAISGIAPGSYQLRITRPGYTFAPMNVELRANDRVIKALAGTRLARISGTVVDEQKRPMAAVRIASQDVERGGGRFMRGMMRVPPPSAVSAPDGTFSIRVEPDVDLQLGATRTGYPAAKTSTLHLASGERKAGIVLTIANGVAVSGRVLDRNGKPVAGVSVTAAESSNGGGGAPGRMVRRMVMNSMRQRDNDQIQTASDGTFTIRMKEGTYDLVFHREGYATRLFRAMHATASTQPVQITLDPSVEISGRVTRGGAGVDGVRIMAMSEGEQTSAETASDGSFRLTDLSPGQLILTATKEEEFIQIFRPATAPSSNVTIEVPPGSRVSGHVVDKDSKQPVTAFDIGVSTPRGAGGMVFMIPPAMRHVTSDDGSFALDNVPAGQTQIVVNAPGYTTAHAPNINIEEGKSVSDLEIAMDHGVHVVGHVIGPDGSPLPGVMVQLAASGGGRVVRAPGQNTTTVTDANGDYSMDAVESGDKTFSFTLSGYQPAERTATLSGTDGRVDAQLTNGMRVNGIVASDAGAPVGDATVNASSAVDASFGARSTQTDANGSFSFDGLTPGHYSFTATKSGYTSDSARDFDISTGAPVRLTLKSGAVIFGSVTGLTADELQSATVTASSANGGSSAAVDAGGSYRMEGAPVGTVRVSARVGMGLTGGKTSPVQSVQVDAGTPVQVDIAFKSNTVISGHVSRNGSPIDGAVVAFIPVAAEAQTTARTTTANGGQYQVSGLDDATYNVSVVDVQNPTPYTTKYDVHGSGTFDVDMKSAPLRGHVTDTNGTALPDAIVQIHQKSTDAGMRMLNQTVQTDASGLFQVDNVPPGAYTITAQKDGYGTKAVDTTVDDSGGQVEIALAENAGVALRVVDARDGRTLNARVHVTDTTGAAVYDSPFLGSAPDTIKLPLEAGTYSAQISANGYAPQTVTITSPSSPTVGLTPGGSITIQSKGSGLRRARLIGPDGRPYIRYGFFTVDPTPGVTVLTNIAPGMYTVQILGDNSEVTATTQVTVMDGQTVSVEL